MSWKAIAVSSSKTFFAGMVPSTILAKIVSLGSTFKAAAVAPCLSPSDAILTGGREVNCRCASVDEVGEEVTSKVLDEDVAAGGQISSWRLSTSNLRPTPIALLMQLKKKIKIFSFV
jgi:hypothetical protein